MKNGQVITNNGQGICNYLTNIYDSLTVIVEGGQNIIENLTGFAEDLTVIVEYQSVFFNAG